MPRRETEETVRVHVQLFKDDWEWVLDHYKGNVGASKFLRSLVRAYKRQIQARMVDHGTALKTDRAATDTVLAGGAVPVVGDEGEQP